MSTSKLVIIGSTVAAVWTLVTTFITTIAIDRYKTSWSTPQEKLFADRLAAYSDLLSHADSVLSQLSLEIPDDISVPSFPSYKMSSVITAANKKQCQVYPQRCPEGGYIDIGSMGFAVDMLESFETARRKYRLLIPEYLDSSLDRFTETTASEIETLLDYEQEKRKSNHPDVRRVLEGWRASLQAYRQLTKELRKTLGLDYTPANLLTQ